MEQHPDPETKKRGHAGLLIIAPAFVLFLLLVILPGFVDGAYMHLCKPYGASGWYYGCLPEPDNAWMDLYLTPARKVADDIPPMRQFYAWELRLAGFRRAVFTTISGGGVYLSPASSPSPAPSPSGK